MNRSDDPSRPAHMGPLELAPPQVLLLLSMAMVSGYIVFGRALSADIPPIGLVFWRTVIATLVLGALFAPRIGRQ